MCSLLRLPFVALFRQCFLFNTHQYFVIINESPSSRRFGSTIIRMCILRSLFKIAVSVVAHNRNKHQLRVNPYSIANIAAVALNESAEVNPTQQHHRPPLPTSALRPLFHEHCHHRACVLSHARVLSRPACFSRAIQSPSSGVDTRDK
jgi:hypothetical protein